MEYAQTQTVNRTFSTSSQTAKLQAATKAEGQLNYELTGQKDESGADVSYFALDETTLCLDEGTPVGTYTLGVTATAAGNSNYKSGSRDSTVTVTVNKAAAVPAQVTANDRLYDGKAKPLVTVDASTLVGGKMQYAPGTDATTAPAESAYTGSIPAGTDAGTYYVWYKAKGDVDHNDSEPACVEVTIRLIDKTALDNAITDALSYYESIRNDRSYSAIASALKNAIDKAREVSADKDADASTVGKATKEITVATAEASKAKAETDQDTAEAAQVKAEEARKAAEEAKADAVKAEDEALKSEKAAEKAQAVAENGQKDAEDAQKVAEKAQAKAEADKEKAEQAKAKADKAKAKAEKAKKAAEKKAANAKKNTVKPLAKVKLVKAKGGKKKRGIISMCG